MLKLAINATSVAPGGGLTVLTGLLEGWKTIGWDARITVYASRPEVLDACGEVRTDIELLPFAVNAPSHRHFLKQRMSLGRILEKHGYNAVYSNQTAVGRCDIPQLVHHQNLKRFQFPGYFTRLRLNQFSESVKDFAARQAMKESACNVFISQHMLSEAERICTQNREKNHVVYNGISETLILASKQSESQWNGSPTIFALQGTATHKDNSTLIHMMARLVKMDPHTPWQLRVAGEGDWDTYQALCKELGIANRVEFLGFVPVAEFDEYLRSACCLVFTSILEGFGLPVIEAMARCCPPIACDCTALPEVVGNAGILVAAGDETAFAQAVKSLFHDTERRAQLVEHGKKQITKFSWTRSAKQMASLLESIAK